MAALLLALVVPVVVAQHTLDPLLDSLSHQKSKSLMLTEDIRYHGQRHITPLILHHLEPEDTCEQMFVFSVQSCELSR